MRRWVPSILTMRYAISHFVLAGFALLVSMPVESAPQGLTVTTNFAGRPVVDPGDPLELRLNRPLRPGEGKLALLIGQMDVTNLLTETANGVQYTPAVPLSIGTSEVVVFLTAGDDWKELARFPLQVLPTQVSDPTQDPLQPQVRTQSGVSQRNLGEPAKLRLRPTIVLGIKSQAVETHTPLFLRERPTFVDYTLQANLQSSWQGRSFGFANQFDVAGSSFQGEALRTAIRGKDAPQVDLPRYLMSLQLGRARLQAGQMAFGSQRHMISRFGSRGLQLMLPLWRWVGFNLAAFNGSDIVGWDNFFGVSNRSHRVVLGTLGLELIPNRPGGLRFEATVMDGSLLPIGGFNQGVVNDAEKSRAKGVRVVASDRSARFSLDSGYSRSRFSNPADPLLEQGNSLVPTSEDTGNARYLDATWNILQSRAITNTTLNLSATYRHERVDPLYRSPGAISQADRLQNQLDLTTSLGPVNVLFTHLRAHNNLLGLPSILTVNTRRNALALSVLLPSLITNNRASLWMPMVSYSIDRTYQVGAGFPPIGFINLSQVPDQMSANQNAGLEWQLGRYRAAYSFNRSSQDNRQPGRESADLRNLVSGISFGGPLLENLDLTYEQSIESARNFELGRTDRLYRSGVHFDWRMTRQSTLVAMLSGTRAGDLGHSSRRRNLEANIQWSHRLNYGDPMSKVQTQFFVRYANLYGFTSDVVFGFSGLRKSQTLNGGLTVTFY